MPIAGRVAALFTGADARGAGVDDRIVVLIDDDEGNRAVMTAVLRDAGFDVHAYASSDQASDERAGVVLVVLDGGQPMRDIDAPTVIVSAASDIAEQAKRFGARAWLRKPFAIDALIEIVRDNAA